MTRKRRDVAAEADAALQDMAHDFRGIGLMSDATYRKITMHQHDTARAITLSPLSGDDIRALREQANMSQAVFARYLNLTTGYVSQLERGAKQPGGAALALLNVIRRHGMEPVPR